MRIWKIVVGAVVFLFVCELGLRLIGLGPKHKYYLTATPRTFLQPDSVVAWKLSKGVYTLYSWDTSNIFKATLNTEGNRITSLNDNDSIKGKARSIQVYGCSFIFGISVADSSTSCYKLQQLLPGVTVKNKGVPAYGLAQMYLSLQQSLKAGDTPTIAIFNYGDFHDWRTAEDKSWSALLSEAISNGYSPAFRQMKYPYMDQDIHVRYAGFNDLYKSWPLREQSAVVNAANTIIYAIPDILHKKYFHSISEKTAFQIMRYCKSNHIIPVFASVTPGDDDILDSLSAAGFYTLDYGIVVWQHSKTNMYNCGPLDPEHPNGLAHTIYAKKMFEFVENKKLLCSH